MAGGIGLAGQQIGNTFKATLAGVADPQAGVHVIFIQPAQLHGIGAVQQHHNFAELSGIADHGQHVLFVLMQGQGADAVRVLHHHFAVFAALTRQHNDGNIVIVVFPALLQLRGVERFRFFTQHGCCVEIAGRIRAARNRQVVAGYTRG